MRIYEAFLSTAKAIPFAMISPVDHATPIAGRTCTVTVRKPGGSWGAASGAVTEIAGGTYYWSAASGDLDTLGATMVKVAATGADDLYFLVEVKPVNVAANLVQVLGTTLTETVGGYLAAAFKKLFDVATPLLVASDAMRGTDGAYTGTPPTADAIGTDAASKVLATPANKLVTDASGYVTANNDIGAAVDASTTGTTVATNLDAKVSEAGGGLTAQEVANAVHNLAPESSAASGSIGDKLDAVAKEGTVRSLRIIDWDDDFPTAISSWLPFSIEYDPITLDPTAITLTGDHAGEEFDVAHYKVAETSKFYTGYPGGSDSKDGLSEANSFASIGKGVAAVKAAGGGTLSIYPKRYNRTLGRFVITDADINLIPDGGQVYIGMYDTLTWSLVAETTATYTATRSTASAAYDGLNLDANGDFSKLVKDEAYGGGELTAGHWYTDGTSVWARAIDDRTLIGDENFFVYLQAGNAITGESTVYMENITLEGDSFFYIHENDSGAKVPTVYAKDCTFAYATGSHGIQVEGAHTFFQGCVVKHSRQDGFNYHPKDGVFCHSVEIDCEGRNCGASGSHTNNASSSHDGCSIVRLRTIGHDTDGYCIGDVDQGVEGEITYSWNVGCIAYGTIEHYAAYYSGNSTPGGMWLIGCESRETDYKDVQLTSDGIIYHYGCIGFYDVNVTEGSSYTELPPNVTLAALPAAYDAAKTAAQAGDEMDLVDAPNATGVGVIADGAAAAVDASATGTTVATNLDAKVSEIGGTSTDGTTTYDVTYTVMETDDVTPIAGVTVTMSRSATGTGGIGSEISDVDGKTYWLDMPGGDWYVFRRKSGRVFSNPVLITVPNA